MAKNPILELFLQGGLGNQLLQQAYAYSLAKRTGIGLIVNPLLLDTSWAGLRRIQARALAFPDLQILPLKSTRLTQWRGLLNLISRLAIPKAFVVRDSLSDQRLVLKLCEKNWRQPVPMLGYFQRAHSFGGEAGVFWKSLADNLRAQYNLKPQPIGQVAIHVRRGDYLTLRGQQMYASISVGWQVEQALRWRQKLGSHAPIQMFSDDTQGALEECPASLRKEIVVHNRLTVEDDFFGLASHRHIVASNSTFGLVASQLSSLLWKEEKTAILPPRWFMNQELDGWQQAEWNDLSFCLKPIE